MNKFQSLTEEDEVDLAQYADVLDLEAKPRPAKKKVKHFHLQAKIRPPHQTILGFWKDWQNHGRYATQAQAEQAARDLTTRYFWDKMDYQIVNHKTKQVIPINLSSVKREFDSANATATA